MTQVYAAFFTAIVCFGSYPLAVRAAAARGMATPFVLTTASLLTIGLVTLYCRPSFSLPTASWLWLGLAGVMMATGFMGFTYLLARPELHVSMIVPLLNCTTALVAVLGSAWFFAEPFTLRKCIGIAAAILAIVLLRPQGP